jgi:pimeloyl-ACP methyl ester carboxylesterase
VASLEEVELSAGRIQYRHDGDGPAVVFVHGVFVDSAVWRKLESPLSSAGFHTVAPTWPLGSHLLPMHANATVSPRAVAALVGEFLDVLDLRDVTLVASDTGGAIVQLLLASGCHDRIARVVLTPCDSFDNFLPPSIRILQYIARVPGLLTVGVQPLRSRFVRRLVYRTLAKHAVPDDIATAWIRPMLTSGEVRRDTARFLAAIDHRDTVAAASVLRSFDKPVLLVWPRGAPYFPFEHAQRWIQILPDARLVDAGDSFTFVSEDQPELLASEIVSFIHTTRLSDPTKDMP